MNQYETIGTKLLRWLIIWAVLFVIICLAAVMTHWNLVSSWFQGTVNGLIEYAFQILLIIVAIGALIGFFRRH